MGLGVALAGGGLKSVAHIGCLKAFEELGLKIDYISGTSAGSMIAVMYALGYTMEETKELIEEYYSTLTNIDKKKVAKAITGFMLKNKVEVEGLIQGEKIEELVNKYAAAKGVRNISDITMPFAVATVDTISTHECICISKDYGLQNEDIEYITDIPIGKAVRASMAFSGIFTTCDFDKYNFIDGGTKDNLPTRILKDMGATEVIGINFKFDPYTPKGNMLEVLLRTVDIYSIKDIIEGQKWADLSIEVDVRGTSLLTIDDVDKCYNSGYSTIMENKEKICGLLSIKK